MFPDRMWEKCSNKIKSGSQSFYTKVKSNLCAVLGVSVNQWTDQNLSLDSALAWNSKNKKELSSAENSYLVWSVTVVAPSIVIGELGYTPAFWIWGSRPPPPRVLSLTSFTMPFLFLIWRAPTLPLLPVVCLCDTELVSGNVTRSCRLPVYMFFIMEDCLWVGPVSKLLRWDWSYHYFLRCVYFVVFLSLCVERDSVYLSWKSC